VKECQFFFVMKQTILESLLFLYDPAAVVSFYSTGAAPFSQLVQLSFHRNLLRFLLAN
jgi:hypothetical protein